MLGVASDPLPDGGWVMSIGDMTNLVRTEQETSARAHQLESLLACIPQGVCLYGPDRRVVMFNRAYVRLMDGAPLAVGDHLREVIRRRAAAGEYGPGAPDQVFAQQIAFDISRPQIRRRLRPNGMVIDVRTAPMPDGGHVSVVSDITPLTRAEHELSRRANEMDAMLASIRHGIMLWGADRRLIASNPVTAELLGLPPRLFVPGRDSDEFLDDLVQAGHFGRGEDAKAVAQRASWHDWTQRWQRRFTSLAGRVVESRADPKADGRLAVTLTDMTEAQAAEVALRRAKDAAEAASQAKSRFLAAMSHELRTPLNAVIGFSDALLREAGAPQQARVAEFAQAINDAGHGLLGLVNVILDVARIEGGRFDLAADRIDLPCLARLCLRHADPAAQAAEITLVSAIPGGAAAAAGR